MSYLIHNDKVLATTTETLKSGQWVQVAHQTSVENIDQSRDLNLVNAFDVKVSNAKKWSNQEVRFSAVAINNSPDEFVLQ